MNRRRNKYLCKVIRKKRAALFVLFITNLITISCFTEQTKPYFFTKCLLLLLYYLFYSFLLLTLAQKITTLLLYFVFVVFIKILHKMLLFEIFSIYKN